MPCSYVDGKCPGRINVLGKGVGWAGETVLPGPSWRSQHIVGVGRRGLGPGGCRFNSTTAPQAPAQTLDLGQVTYALGASDASSVKLRYYCCPFSGSPRSCCPPEGGGSEYMQYLGEPTDDATKVEMLNILHCTFYLIPHYAHSALRTILQLCLQ